jgi:hypothetical protein
MSAFPPFYPANTHPFEVAGTQTHRSPVGLSRVGPRYFELYGVPCRQGREFTPADRVGGESVAVISETLARDLWPDESAVGHQIRVVEGDLPGASLGPWRAIVGVVGDVRQGYEDSDLRDIYLPFLQVPSRFGSVHVWTERPLSFWRDAVQTAATTLDPYVIVNAGGTIVSEDRQKAGTHFLASILGGFASFSVLVAVLGIYGVTAYAARQREREIGVRLAVGATRGAIQGMFLKEGAGVILFGVGLGLLGALGTVRILEHQVYGVEPMDLATLVAGCLVMTAVGLATVWWPAHRAAQGDLMAALRTE